MAIRKDSSRYVKKVCLNRSAGAHLDDRLLCIHRRVEDVYRPDANAADTATQKADRTFKKVMCNNSGMCSALFVTTCYCADRDLVDVVVAWMAKAIRARRKPDQLLT